MAEQPGAQAVRQDVMAARWRECARSAGDFGRGEVPGLFRSVASSCRLYIKDMGAKLAKFFLVSQLRAFSFAPYLDRFSGSTSKQRINQAETMQSTSQPTALSIKWILILA